MGTGVAVGLVVATGTLALWEGSPIGAPACVVLALNVRPTTRANNSPPNTKSTALNFMNAPPGQNGAMTGFDRRCECSLLAWKSSCSREGLYFRRPSNRAHGKCRFT